MVIPNYLPITNDQYEQLTSTDEDTAVDLAMDWMEEETTGPGTDIDKTADDLATALTTPEAKQAVTGHTLLCEDPALYVASPQQTAVLAQALANSTVDEDAQADLDTLTDFYATAVTNNHATAILYN